MSQVQNNSALVGIPLLNHQGNQPPRLYATIKDAYGHNIHGFI